MEAQPVVVLAGPRWTRALFAAWAQRPLPVLAPWALGSFALGAALLGAALAVALVSAPGAAYTPVFADPAAGAADVARIVLHNPVVLTLQVVVCTGVHLALRSGADRRSRTYGLAAIVGLWAYSFASQAWRLGHELASAAHTLGLTSAGLLARLCVHAVPELTAVFLPLAACVALVRRGRADDVAAATLLTSVVAFPMVVCAASVEVFLTRYVV